MISQVNSSNIYQGVAVSNSKSKADVATKTEQTSQKTHIEELKEAIQNGTYKVDLQKTAEKMAEELL